MWLWYECPFIYMIILQIKIFCLHSSLCILYTSSWADKHLIPTATRVSSVSCIARNSLLQPLFHFTLIGFTHWIVGRKSGTLRISRKKDGILYLQYVITQGSCKTRGLCLQKAANKDISRPFWRCLPLKWPTLHWVKLNRTNQ